MLMMIAEGSLFNKVNPPGGSGMRVPEESRYWNCKFTMQFVARTAGVSPAGMVPGRELHHVELRMFQLPAETLPLVGSMKCRVI
jgi:hypothetical protein